MHMSEGMFSDIVAHIILSFHLFIFIPCDKIVAGYYGFLLESVCLSVCPTIRTMVCLLYVHLCFISACHTIVEGIISSRSFRVFFFFVRTNIFVALVAH